MKCRPDVFVAQEGLARDQLRQGDVVEWYFFPSQKPTAMPLVYVSQQAERRELDAALVDSAGIGNVKNWHEVTIVVRRSFAAIVSQCCDLARDDRDRFPNPTLLVSPLVEVPYGTRQDPEKLARLKENSLANFSNMYFIERQDPLPSDMVVDFCRALAVPFADFDVLCERKVLQLTDAERVRFKIKLGQHFARPTRDELESGVYDQVAGGLYQG